VQKHFQECPQHPDYNFASGYLQRSTPSPLPHLSNLWCVCRCVAHGATKCDIWDLPGGAGDPRGNVDPGQFSNHPPGIKNC